MIQNPLIILWADGNLARARSSRVELRRRGARVLMASSAEKAIALAELLAPELFVLEDELGTDEPGDLAAQVRSAFPSAEIILLSSKPREGLRGVDDGLLYCCGTQPVPLETLISLIQMAFPGRLEQREGPKPKPKTVLCVDDDPESLRSLSRFLTRHGYQVGAFEDPRKALEAISAVHPDLAILDVMMPGMDGHALAGRIRKEYSDRIPLVILSARNSSADIAAASRCGASNYLSKPCQPQKLLDLVDYYLGDLDPEERDALLPKGMVDGGMGPSSFDKAGMEPEINERCP